MMRRQCAIGSAILAVLLVALAVAASAQGTFPLKDGDTWVMVGDSITAQHLHSNYFEAFCYARFPKLTFCFRNSGVGGDTIPRVLARFDYDVAGWKPTVVSVELGMNDAGGFTPEKFLEGMGTLIGRIRGVSARPVLFTASPVNNGSPPDRLDGHNTRLGQFAAGLKELAAKEGVPFTDQFNALVGFWAQNKPMENIANSLNTLRSLIAAQPNMLGAEHVRALLDVWSKADKQPVTMMGDGVHPGPPGQLAMAAALLTGLNAPGLVSTATINAAAGKVDEAAQCKVENVRLQDGALSFDRLDEALPFPIPDDARPVVAIAGTIADLSQYRLIVTGLAAASYDITVDGAKVATVPAADLAAGWNMGTLDKGPVADQCRSILQLVSAKEGLVGQWRGVSRSVVQGGATAQQPQLEALAGQVRDADAKIRAAAVPRPHHFVLTPAK